MSPDRRLRVAHDARDATQRVTVDDRALAHALQRLRHALEVAVAIVVVAVGGKIARRASQRVLHLRQRVRVLLVRVVHTRAVRQPHGAELAVVRVGVVRRKHTRRRCGAIGRRAQVSVRETVARVEAVARRALRRRHRAAIQRRIVRVRRRQRRVRRAMHIHREQLIEAAERVVRLLRTRAQIVLPVRHVHVVQVVVRIGHVVHVRDVADRRRLGRHRRRVARQTTHLVVAVRARPAQRVQHRDQPPLGVILRVLRHQVAPPAFAMLHLRRPPPEVVVRVLHVLVGIRHPPQRAVVIVCVARRQRTRRQRLRHAR